MSETDDPIPLGATSAPEPESDVTPALAAAPVGTPTEEDKRLAFAKFQATDLTVIGEIIDRMEKYPFLGTPYDLDIRVVPQESNSRAILGRFPFADVLDAGMSPPDKLRELIIERYHLPLARGPKTYEIVVLWKKTGRVYARFRMDLPSPDALTAVARQAAQQPPPPPAMGYAPPYAGAYAPHAPPRYGAPPPAPAPGPAGLGSDVHMLMGALTEALAAAREGRQPNLPAPASSADPVLVQLAEMRAEIAALRAERAAPPTVAAPPPQAVAAAPTPPHAIEQFMRTGTEKVLMSILGVAMKGLERGIHAGLGQVPPENSVLDEPPPPPVPTEPPEPEEPPPFTTIAVSKWGDGRDVNFAKDTATGDVHWMGLALSNPILIEKVMSIGESLAQPIVSAVQRKFQTLGETPVGAPPAQEHAPAAAAPPPRTHAAPPPAAPPPPPPPPPPADGAAASAWPPM